MKLTILTLTDHELKQTIFYDRPLIYVIQGVVITKPLLSEGRRRSVEQIRVICMHISATAAGQGRCRKKKKTRVTKRNTHEEEEQSIYSSRNKRILRYVSEIMKQISTWQAVVVMLNG